MGAFFSGLNLGQVPGGDDRNCGEWVALFFFLGLILWQVPGRADRNCGEWIALFFSSGLNLGQMLGRADSIFLSLFSLSCSQSSFFSRFLRPQPCLTCPLLSSLLLSLTLFQKAEHFRFYRKVQSSIIDFECHSRFIMTVRCVSKHAPKIGPFFLKTHIQNQR